MLRVLNYFTLIIAAFVLLLLVDDNPHEVRFSEWLLFGIMLASAYSLFKVLIELYKRHH